MDKTVLTLAVDSSQVGTAAAAFDRMVNAGNAAATSAGRVTAASIAEGRAISQVLVPALNSGINRARNLAETQQALGQDATRQVAQQAAAVRAPAGYASTPALTPQSVTTGRAVPTTAPRLFAGSNASLGQLAGGASSAQGAIDRLTAAARNNRSALAQLTPAATAVAGSYRQLSAMPIRLDAQQGLSAAAAALSNVAAQGERARRSIADLSRIPAPTQQPLVSQIAARQAPTNPSVASMLANAPSPSNASAASVATTAAHGATATNAFAVAEGRAAEAAQRLAEANARSEVAQARLAVATERAAAAQREFDNVSRSSAGNAEAITQAQTRLQSAQAAVSMASANVTRSQRDATTAAERHRITLNSLGRQSQLTAFQQQQLHYQLHDFFVQVVSGQSPLTAFIQQGSQLSGTFNGAGGAFRAVTSLITPMRVAIGGTAGAVAALGYAYYEGARQSKAFADAVVLTGNYAGQTEGQITALTRQIASHGEVTVSAAREAAQAALGSGQIGSQVFAQATEAIALYAQATDKAAEDVVKDFAEMARSPSRWAEEHNRTLHFITAAQYDAIKAFEDAGKSADAQGVIYGALNERLKKLDPNLGTIERTLRSVKGAWSSFWDAAYDVGRTETIESKIANIDAKIRESRRGSNPFAPAAQSRTAQLAGKDPKSLEYELQDQLAGQQVQQANAFNEAAKAEAQQAGITAKAVVDGYLKRGKAASLYKEKLDELNRSFKDRAAAGTPVSAADQKVALAELKKEFTPPKNSEASQVLRAQYEQQVKGYKDVLDKEKAELTFHNQFLQNQYQAGEVSLKAFYDDRIDSIRKATAQEITELDKERAAAVNLLAKTKDPSEKVQAQTRINEIDNQKEKLQTGADHEIKLTNQEKTASFKALSDQVTNYRANLLQMQGDEAGAAATRAQLAIENAKLLQAQASGRSDLPKVDVEGLTRAIAITDRYNEVQRQTSLLAANSSRAEEAYLLAAEQSGKSLFDTERGLFALRSNELEQLGALAQKAKELADISKSPALKEFAADLALSYAKAANAADPALQRLREMQKDVASGIAGTINNGIASFGQNYLARRQQQAQDTLNGGKAESATTSVLKTIGQTVVLPIAGQIQASISKVLISDPLQKYLEAEAKRLTEGDSPLAGFFKDALGIKDDPKQQALLQQTAAITASTSAVDALRIAAESAANALNRPLVSARAPQGEGALTDALDRSGVNQSGGDATQPPPIDSSLEGAPSEASKALAAFGQQTSVTAADVVKLASAAGAGGDAMVRLPGIVGLFQSAVAAMQTSSAASGSSGGIFGTIASLFGGSSSAGSAGATDAMIAAGQFHSGGLVGQASVVRHASSGLFAGAPRYHTGGLVGKAADKAGAALRHDEVPAILMGGPKGKREEVLRADDPRHRDNLGMSIVARIMSEAKSSELPFAKAAKDQAVHHTTVSTLLQTISGSKGGGEWSANVLAGVLDRLGVKDGEESAASSVLRIRGARELGGPVSAGGMYRVNERGPELLEVAGKQYLMMGSQGGSVESNGGGANRQPRQNIVHVNVTPPVGASRTTAQQWGAEAGRHIQQSLRRGG